MKTIFDNQKQWFKKGYSKSITYREAMLRTLKTTLKENEALIVEALYEDLGKHPKEAYTTELFMVYKSINHTIRNLRKYTKDRKVKTPIYLKPASSYTRKLPYGVSLIMSAYNYPLLLSIDPIVGAIAGGNTVMLALSGNSHHTNQVLIKILNEAFDPEYLYAFETNRALNQEILAYPFDKIFFTGSEKVGKIVLKAASENLVPVTLELGGKSPAVVLRDANLKTAADNIMYSKVINAGQTCIASDYVLVDHMIADEFIEYLQKSLDKFYPNLKQYPKMVNENEYSRIIEMIKHDESYLISDLIKDDEALKIKTALLKVRLSDASKLSSMKQEIFGPVLPILVYEDLNEALRFINAKATPLALYIFGKRRKMIDHVLVHVDSGGASINSTIMHMVNENLPFGGFRQSGMGSYHGKYSVDTFTHTQGVYRKRFLNIHKVIFPPYKERK